MIATCMGWLNDVKAGGATAFIEPNEEVLFEPRKGSMGFWIDTNANTDVLKKSIHGGCPVSTYMMESNMDVELNVCKKSCQNLVKESCNLFCFCFVFVDALFRRN